MLVLTKAQVILKIPNGDVASVGTASNNLQYVKTGGLVTFDAPDGQHFMDNGTLMSGSATLSSAVLIILSWYGQY